MVIKLVVVGKDAFAYLKDGIEIYTKRLSFYTSFEIVVIPDIKGAKSMSEAQIKLLEGKEILKKVDSKDSLILLDEKGREFNSLEFASFVESSLTSFKKIIFVIGGAYGFDDEVYDRADIKIALSKMTLSHQMVRLFFVEQLYRAFTIIKGEPYHHQ